MLSKSQGERGPQIWDPIRLYVLREGAFQLTVPGRLSAALSTSRLWTAIVLLCWTAESGERQGDVAVNGGGRLSSAASPLSRVLA